jgi:hypothetical protein
MAIAVANVQVLARLSGGIVIGKAQITLDNNYPTGGSAGVLNGIGGLAALHGVLAQKSLGFDFDYDAPTDRLKAYQQPAAAAAGPSPEVPNTTNMSANVLPVIFIGQAG